jgi:cell volume regulation protein A
MIDSVAQVLEIVAAVLLLGALGEFVFARTGIPDVIWLVCAGVLAGPVFEIVSPSLLEPAVPLFGALALIIILSGGAYRLRLEDVAAAGPRAPRCSRSSTTCRGSTSRGSRRPAGAAGTGRA